MSMTRRDNGIVIMERHDVNPECISRRDCLLYVIDDGVYNVVLYIYIYIHIFVDTQVSKCKIHTRVYIYITFQL